MKRLTNLRKSEQGMVSIIVTMIIMSVLSLIVVGFAQLARREQREALDNQLSTQAFYAAESGINDARIAIKNGYAINKKDCTDDTTFSAARKAIGTDGNVAYTCLLIDQTPSKLEYGTIEVDKATVVPINPVDTDDNNAAMTLKELNIGWNRADGGGSDYYNDGFDGITLPPATDWTSSEAGILRVDLIPLPNGPLTRSGLIDQTFTVFLYPSVGAAAETGVQYQRDIGNQGTIQRIACNTTGARKCNARIDNLPPGVEHYYLKLTSLYHNSAVTVSGEGASSVNSTQRPVAFKDGQYIIDSTGKAGDVLKRIRVHLPAGKTDYRYPNYAVNSVQEICKLLEVYPGGGSDLCNNH